LGDKAVVAGLVQQLLFHDVEWYLKSKNLTFYLLLILDNAPAPMQDLGLVNPNIQVCP
jgi:hypothetical protein